MRGIRFARSKNPVKPKTVQDYIFSKPKEAQERLSELRSYLIEAAPHASEELKWGKPALVKNGILYVYAATKNHISLHPTPSVISHLHDELGPLVASENTIHFPLDKPIPKALVIKIANLRVFENEKMGIKWK
jgi:uncharacterized protein YdhG (YjbR/CyaY superfamily)